MLASCFLFVLDVACYVFELLIIHLLNNPMKSVQYLMTYLGYLQTREDYIDKKIAMLQKKNNNKPRLKLNFVPQKQVLKNYFLILHLQFESMHCTLLILYLQSHDVV